MKDSDPPPNQENFETRNSYDDEPDSWKIRPGLLQTESAVHSFGNSCNYPDCFFGVWLVRAWGSKLKQWNLSPSGSERNFPRQVMRCWEKPGTGVVSRPGHRGCQKDAFYSSLELRPGSGLTLTIIQCGCDMDGIIPRAILCAAGLVSA